MIHFRKKDKQDGARMRASPRVKEKEIEEVDVIGCGARDDAGGKLPPGRSRPAVPLRAPKRWTPRVRATYVSSRSRT